MRWASFSLASSPIPCADPSIESPSAESMAERPLPAPRRAAQRRVIAMAIPHLAPDDVGRARSVQPDSGAPHPASSIPVRAPLCLPLAAHARFLEEARAEARVGSFSRSQRAMSVAKGKLAARSALPLTVSGTALCPQADSQRQQRGQDGGHDLTISCEAPRSREGSHACAGGPTRADRATASLARARHDLAAARATGARRRRASERQDQACTPAGVPRSRPRPKPARHVDDTWGPSSERLPAGFGAKIRGLVVSERASRIQAMLSKDGAREGRT